MSMGMDIYDVERVKDKLRTRLGTIALQGEIREMLERAEAEYNQSGNASYEGRTSEQAHAMVSWLRNLLDVPYPSRLNTLPTGPKEDKNE